MQKVKVKKSSNGYVLTMKLSDFTASIQQEITIMSSIPQLLPTELTSGLFSASLQTVCIGKEPLKDWLRTAHSTEDYLFCLNCMLAVAIECKNSGLRPENLGWSSELIFRDPAYGSIAMSYWPSNLQQGTDDFYGFFDEMLLCMNQNMADPFITDGLNTCIYSSSFDDLQGLLGACQKLQSTMGYSSSVAAADCAHKSSYVQPVQQNIMYLQSAIDGQKIVLSEFPAKLGTNPNLCNVMLMGGCGISRCHAEIQCNEFGYFIMDLNSTNGTFLNRNRLEPNALVPLYPGDMIGIGNQEYSLVNG